MKKKEFLEKIIRTVFGRHYLLKAGENGNMYWVVHEDDPRDVRIMWVDLLGGGRISIKFKCFEYTEAGLERANRLAKALFNAVYYMDGMTIDAATVADTFIGNTPRFGKYYVARLRCDKVW